MTALTRGPLPARVYWRRRVLLVVLAMALVIGVTRLLTLGSDASSEDTPEAARTAVESTGPSSPAASSAPATRGAGAKQERPGKRAGKKQKRGRDRRPVLADPEGVCADRDVAVTPTVDSPAGGSPVTFTLELRTLSSPACTWQVSPTTLTMKLTSGKDEVWSSRQCPRAIPREEVVVRNNATTEVEVTWSGRRSDLECSALTQWALPGWYHVSVAALAGEPSDLQFQLEKPEPGVVTRTVRPEPRKGKQDRDRTTDREQNGRDRG